METCIFPASEKIATVFRDADGIVLAEYLKHSSTFSETYSGWLNSFVAVATSEKKRGKLQRGAAVSPRQFLCFSTIESEFSRNAAATVYIQSTETYRTLEIDELAYCGKLCQATSFWIPLVYDVDRLS